MKKNKISSTHSGFTLIEMLVVIAIIVTLAGLIVPAISASLKTVKRNKAATEAKNIAGAIDLFFKENGYFPTSKDQGFSEDYGREHSLQSMSEGDAAEIIRVLMGDNTITSSGSVVLNPSGTAYLDSETPIVNGEYLDPWGIPYRIKLDLDYNGKIEFFSEPEYYHKRSIVVSFGADRKMGADKDSKEFKDNVANVLLLTK